MKFKNTLFVFKFLFISIIKSQSYYDYNSDLFSLSYFDNDSIAEHRNIWEKYYLSKGYSQTTHSFGLAIKLNESNNKILYQKSDLIGDGFITNYRFNYKNLEILNSMFFSNKSEEASRGFVRTIKDVSMYTNQAYLSYKFLKDDFINFNIKIGRDFNRIGYGIDANLFVSNFSRPFDMLSFNFKYKDIKSSISVIELDTMKVNSLVYNRFLYLHTFEFLFENFRILIGESLIVSGENQLLSLKYLNPFHLWSWENNGKGEEGLNAVLFSGISWTFHNTNRLYLELIIDDINFHRKNAFFLNRFAYLIGFNKVNFPFKSSKFYLEYSSVLNQVYQSFHPSHIFVHMNYPIGHHLGNDLKFFRAHFSSLILSYNTKLFFDLAFVEKGQNSLETEFKALWENNDGSINESYVYPGHPSKPIVSNFEFEIGLQLKIKKQIFLTLSLQGQKSSNYDEDLFLFNSSARLWFYSNILNLR